MSLIVSLTATSDNLKSALLTTLSILKQKIRPDQLILNIPGSKGFIPNELEHLTKLNLLTIEYTKDWKAFTKLAPTLEKYWNLPDTKIIAIDNQTIYSPHFLEQMLETEKRHPCHAICNLARAYPKDLKGNLFPPENSYQAVDTLQLSPGNLAVTIIGKYGALYKPKFFSKEILDYDKYMEAAPYSDDLWISAHLAKNGIPIWIIPFQPQNFQNVQGSEKSDQTQEIWAVMEKLTPYF